MSTSPQRFEILRMIKEGKITPEEGIKLLEATEAGSTSMLSQPPPPSENAIPPMKNARWLRVRVTDMVSRKVRVNIRLPVSMLNAGMKMGAHISPDIKGLDQSQLLAMIGSGQIGKIVDVYDEEDGEHVEVFIE